MQGALKNRKTYIVAAIAFLAAWGAVLTGDMETAEAVKATFAALMAMTMRAGVAKAQNGTPAVMLLLPLLLFAGGCEMFATKADSDASRAGWGDTRGMPVILKGVFFGSGWRPIAFQDLDDHVATFGNANAAALQAKIDEFKVELAEAEAAEEPDPEEIGALKVKIAALEDAMEEQNGGVTGTVHYVDTGDVTIHTSGTTDTDASGETTATQTPAGPQFSIPVSVTGGAP